MWGWWALTEVFGYVQVIAAAWVWLLISSGVLIFVPLLGSGKMCDIHGWDSGQMLAFYHAHYKKVYLNV